MSVNPFDDGTVMHIDWNNREFEKLWHYVSLNVHNIAISKGWWEDDRSDGELLALVHSEVSEALEALRNGNPPDDKIPRFSGAEAELADVIIRIMDMSVARGWDIAGAIISKIAYNDGREYKHGGKLF